MCVSICMCRGYPTIPEQHGTDFTIALAGNGMHLHVFFIFVVWTLACSELLF